MDLGDTSEFFLRIGSIIAVFTLVLTASFVGILAVLSGQMQAYEGRIPWYLVGAALTFVSVIILLEVNKAPGQTIIVTAVVVGAITFLGLFLSVEGFAFAIHNPEIIILEQLGLYFFAAALVATGIGYWGLKHWREFTEERDNSPQL